MDKAVIAETYIIGCFASFQTEKDGIVQLPSVGTFESFCDALTVWINKPHVANRRLIGSKILYQNNTCTTEARVDSFIKKCLSSAENAEVIHGFVEEVPPLSSFVDASFYFIIRENFYKGSRQTSSKETIVIDFRKKLAAFIPFTGVGHERGENIDTNDKGSKQAKSTVVPYQIGFTEESGNSWITLNTPERESETEKSYIEWLQTTLLRKLVNWSSEKKLRTSVTSLRLVPVDRYNELYNTLKDKYGRKFVEIWPEKTDPQKFVYEDVAIATYLLIIWEMQRKEQKSETLQSFVDLGCGNGLLVHILQSEGHPGLGLDVRKRSIWDLYGKETKLKEESIRPSAESIFPDFDWLIGNHSDELTPWIPVIAARSSYKCSYFVLPCCHFDFNHKFSQKEANESNYRSYLNFVQKVGEVCGFSVQEDTLRIPSTKRVCFIGKTRNYQPEEMDLIDDRIANYIRLRSTLSSVPENTEDNPPKRLKTDEMWDEGFTPRSSVEKARNCRSVDVGTVNHIVRTVFDTLLNSEDCETRHLEGGRVWRKGGKKSLGDIVKLFDQDVLKQLKSECGGLQTLLRNHNSVFNVSGGAVQLRDLTLDEPYSKHSKLAKRDKSRHFKTLQCWFHHHHPDGCPRTAATCHFAHGEMDTRKENLINDT
uniref:tRNA (uracil-O(2)-)-methyltransferase n=1 Tax=Crassostrea virginica TaxID=6565 RepID=A0A8B8EU64_CRAVI|nr:probable tRNA (uracil-O(2)-)-methyltransferase [Crassostrea virginica]